MQGFANQEQDTVNRKVVVNLAVLAATTATATSLITARTGFTVYIQKIVISVTTTAAQTTILADSAGTPVVIAGLAASPALGPYTWDFGPEGTPLTESTGLTYTLSAAGLAYRLHIQAYYRQTSPLTVTAHAST